MSLKDYYDEFRRGYWADEDPNVCKCRGSGYALSDVDTWHECPFHYRKGQRHPEDDYPEHSLTPSELTFSPPPPAPYVPLTDEDIPF